MDPLFGTLVLISLALLGARLSFSTLRVPAGPRLLFRTGTHFVFIGFLLGPKVMGLLTETALEQLRPLLALGLGWVGFLFGLQLDRESLGRFPGRYYVVAFGQALVALLLFFGVGWVALDALGRGDSPELLILLSLAAATAAISTPAGIALVSANFLVRGHVRELLFFVASVDALVGIVAVQLTYSWAHPNFILLTGELVAIPLGIVLAVCLGVISGILLLWLTRERDGGDRLALFVLGITALAAGAALQLQVSPLFVATLMGAVVANFSTQRNRLFHLLQGWEKPIYMVLLLLSGALLTFPTLWVVPVALAYALVRVAGKVAGGWVATRAAGLGGETPGLVGLGLLPQGGIVLALAVGILLTYSGLPLAGFDGAELLFEVVVLAVVLSELVGPVTITRLLRSIGEIAPQVERAIEEGDERGAEEAAIRHHAPPKREEEG